MPVHISVAEKIRYGLATIWKWSGVVLQLDANLTNGEVSIGSRMWGMANLAVADGLLRRSHHFLDILDTKFQPPIQHYMYMYKRLRASSFLI